MTGWARFFGLGGNTPFFRWTGAGTWTAAGAVEAIPAAGPAVFSGGGRHRTFRCRRRRPEAGVGAPCAPGALGGSTGPSLSTTIFCSFSSETSCFDTKQPWSASKCLETNHATGCDSLGSRPPAPARRRPAAASKPRGSRTALRPRDRCHLRRGRSAQGGRVLQRRLQ